MRRLQFLKLISLSLVGVLFLFNCDNNKDIEPVNNNTNNTTTKPLPSLHIKEGAGDTTITVFTSDLESGAQSFKVSIQFSSTNNSIRRMYMTENVANKGANPFEITLANVDKKRDGSLDIPSANSKGFTYEIPFPVRTDITTGTVVYKIWGTSGRGDYRDKTKNFVAGLGTIIVNYGGQNPATAVRSYSAKMFAAPLADGSSQSFISLLDGSLYQINQGEEYAAFWDFGYFYSAASTGNLKASFASTATYETAFANSTTKVGIVNVDSIANTTDLNNAFFKTSTKTSAEFDAITNAKDLDYIVKPSTESISNLADGNIIEFVDNYGKKGLIRVVKITGTYNSGDNIKVDIKVQP